jgi:hypothetical protein
MSFRPCSAAAICLLAFSLSPAMLAQTLQPTAPEISTPPEIATVKVIAVVDAYDDWLGWWPNGFGHQYDTLIVRVDKVIEGKVADPWIRVDYWGSNRNHEDDRLPDAIFEPRRRWTMRLTPTIISGKNYQSCRPLEGAPLTDKNETGTRYRTVSAKTDDLPEPGTLKCYTLTRADLQEVRDSH